MLRVIWESIRVNELLQRMPSAILSLGVALSITYLPGFAVLTQFAATRRIDKLSRWCIAPGVSIALYVVLFEACSLLHIKLNWLTPWVVVVISLLSLVLMQRGLSNGIIPGGWFSTNDNVLNRWRRKWDSITTGEKLAFVILGISLIAAMGIRLWVIRDLLAPPGGDSIHHTLIVQLMMVNGGLFQSWLPYDEATSFNYHFGFHAITTFYAWMRGVGAEFAVLFMGQILNTATILALFALVRLWIKSIWAGAFSVIVGGFISAFPATFINSGRYTQLAGQLILVAAIVLLATYLKEQHRRQNLVYLLLLPIVCAGVAMGQYQIAITFALLCIPLVVNSFLHWLHTYHDMSYALHASVGRVLVIAGLALLFFLPRGLDVLNSDVGRRLNRVLNSQAPQVKIGYAAIRPDAVTLSQTGLDDQNLWIWGLALIGVTIVLVERRQAIWFLVGAMLCALAMNPESVGINRDSLIDSGNLRLSVYIAISTLSGLAVGTLLDMLFQRNRLYNWAAAFGGIALIVAGTAYYPQVDPSSILVHSDDLAVMHWIDIHVPQGEHIAARGIVTFDNTLSSGIDAGWWIPFYTKHLTNLRPYPTGSSNDGQIQAIAFIQKMHGRDMSTIESARWLAGQGYHYFFVGSEESSDPADKILIEQILLNPAMPIVFQNGKAILLAIK